MTGRIAVTDAAREAIARLEEVHGRLMFFQSGGSCDGSSPLCLREGELVLGPHDRLLGEAAGMPVYIDEEQDVRFGRPEFVLDVASGPASEFSLEGSEGVHFILRP
ncbi:DUF779 domain-containing protein [Baekduia soli]|uniref:DUF779 domain-containing protein n=1 Tax=Baekduia soli TaxID=496014 RepID=A0A5B8U0M5_9ACTN|nr:DUF779 domain-containing protein [Baekduia soli]QEC46537.1 DUF779 domain-containing protein [Baekduia soli]